MNRAKSIEEFLSYFPKDREKLETLREIILSTGMEEGIKWGAPIYMYKGKNVIGIGSFKSYVGLWFHQGSFLKDEQKVLINAQEGKTKGLRQWRFAEEDEIPKELLRSYIFEAIENEKQGKRVIPEKQALLIPPELKLELDGNSDLKSRFEALTPFKQKEYANYVMEAKREATKLSRLAKCIPMILEGKGLNDKYR